MTLGVIAFAVLSGLVASFVTSLEIRKIRKSEGLPQGDRILRLLDFSIVTLVSILMQICFMEFGRETMMIAGAFGAFLASAAWSDAKTGFVPDVAIIPTLILGSLLSWSIHVGMPDLMTGLLISLGALMVFALLVIAYLNLQFVKITPPDAIFVLLIVMTPSDIPQMVVMLAVIILCLLLVKTRPDLVRALIPADERQNLTSQMEEALGIDEGDMEKRGWYPLGPIVLICILAGHCVNVLI